MEKIIYSAHQLRQQRQPTRCYRVFQAVCAYLPCALVCLLNKEKFISNSRHVTHVLLPSVFVCVCVCMVCTYTYVRLHVRKAASTRLVHLLTPDATRSEVSHNRLLSLSPTPYTHAHTRTHTPSPHTPTLVRIWSSPSSLSGDALASHGRLAEQIAM